MLLPVPYLADAGIAPIPAGAMLAAIKAEAANELIFLICIYILLSENVFPYALILKQTMNKLNDKTDLKTHLLSHKKAEKKGSVPVFPIRFLFLICPLQILSDKRNLFWLISDVQPFITSVSGRLCRYPDTQ
jgi:hypothetical protein